MNEMYNEKLKHHFHQAGTVLRDLILENADNNRIVDQVHQLINHLLVIKGEVLTEETETKNT